MDGDPSQDVVQAAVIFLVDAKLVLLKPAQDEQGSLKYDMHIVANNVEYFVFIRDQPSSLSKKESVEPNSAIEEQGTNSLRPETALQDSLWYFDGRRMQCWTDIQDILQGNSPDKPRDLPSPVSTITDFYPTSVGLRKGVLIGIDPDVVQRRGAQFAFFRFTIRVSLLHTKLEVIIDCYVDSVILTTPSPTVSSCWRPTVRVELVIPLPAVAIFLSCPRNTTP